MVVSLAWVASDFNAIRRKESDHDGFFGPIGPKILFDPIHWAGLGRGWGLLHGQSWQAEGSRDRVMAQVGEIPYQLTANASWQLSKIDHRQIESTHMPYHSYDLPEIDSLGDLMPAFEFDCLIARGGMGAVYKARQRSLDRDVAIKVFPRELGSDPHFRTKFQTDVRAMARVNHPNLIRVYDSGDLDGYLYIVMEYVHGKSLFHSAHGMAIDSKQAVGIVISACRGLAHAHESGIIHREIEPANILLTPKCEPKIGSFGLAHRTRNDVDGQVRAISGYKAPEIIHRSAVGDVRSDVFAIGVVLRELLTGIPAGSWNATSPMVSDPKLDAVCRIATHSDPASRYPDVSSFAKQLTLWLASQSSKAVGNTKQFVFQPPSSSSQQPTSAPDRPTSATQRPTLAGHPLPRSSGSRMLLKYCAISTLLLCASYVASGFYPKDDQEMVRQEFEVRSQTPTQTMQTGSIQKTP